MNKININDIFVCVMYYKYIHIYKLLNLKHNHGIYYKSQVLFSIILMALKGLIPSIVQDVENTCPFNIMSLQIVTFLVGEGKIWHRPLTVILHLLFGLAFILYSFVV